MFVMHGYEYRIVRASCLLFKMSEINIIGSWKTVTLNGLRKNGDPEKWRTALKMRLKDL